MEWIKKHVDTVIVVGGILGVFMWMNSKFDELKTELTVIKTVLIMKEIMPMEVASNHKQIEK